MDLNDSTDCRWLSELPMDDPGKKSWSKPQLRRFVHFDKPIKRLDFLGAGREGVLYKVRIEGSVYALKFFNEWDYVGISIPEKLQPYASPFANECRAFARLDTIGENGTWAVKCYGWMKLSEDWAIVKDYHPDPIQLSDTPEIRRKMEVAQRAYIHPLDIDPRNYQGSVLVDLGTARTFPYVRALWSDRAFGRVFERLDKTVKMWEIDERDGNVVSGGTNARIRRVKENDAKMRRQAEETKQAEERKHVEKETASIPRSLTMTL